jgi:hypothetical protein
MNIDDVIDKCIEEACHNSDKFLNYNREVSALVIELTYFKIIQDFLFQNEDMILAALAAETSFSEKYALTVAKKKIWGKNSKKRAYRLNSRSIKSKDSHYEINMAIHMAENMDSSDGFRALKDSMFVRKFFFGIICSSIESLWDAPGGASMLARVLSGDISLYMSEKARLFSPFRLDGVMLFRMSAEEMFIMFKKFYDHYRFKDSFYETRAFSLMSDKMYLEIMNFLTEKNENYRLDFAYKQSQIISILKGNNSNDALFDFVGESVDFLSETANSSMRYDELISEGLLGLITEDNSYDLMQVIFEKVLEYNDSKISIERHIRESVFYDLIIIALNNITKEDRLFFIPMLTKLDLDEYLF